MVYAKNAYELKVGVGEWNWDASEMDPNVKSQNVLLIGEAAIGFGVGLNKHGFTPVFAQSIHEARNIILLDYYRLQRCMPEAIIFDIRMDTQLINHFTAYLSSTKEFGEIPLIALVSGEDEDAVHCSLPGNLDDIFSTRCSDKDLCAKIRVLQKYKRFKQTLPYQSQEEKPQAIRAGYLFQRVMDILVSSLILAILSPLLLVIAALIKLDSSGSVFYTSKRAGRDYKIFNFFKFRTMVADADQKIESLMHLNQYDETDGGNAQFFKIDNDPRVTRLGRFLRNSSLDELPQLINVLKGDMSLVGNRPLPLYEARTLVADEAVRRFLAPAGMTGLWQIKKRGFPNMSVQERINLDIDYANQHSFFYDMRILLNTPLVLLQKADA